MEGFETKTVVEMTPDMAKKILASLDRLAKLEEEKIKLRKGKSKAFVFANLTRENVFYPIVHFFIPLLIFSIDKSQKIAYNNIAVTKLREQVCICCRYSCVRYLLFLLCSFL